MSRSNASNYRGINLTAQLSKVAERCIAMHLLPFLERSGAYGRNQFAYRVGRGYKDALAFLTFSWVWALGLGKRIAVYCSDVSGAFDRVSAKLLLTKLEAAGVHIVLLRLLAAWLEDRCAQVCVDGSFSDCFPLSNMVFQGTVLGPPLWNVFYNDASQAIVQAGFTETKFADDLNCFKVVGGGCGDSYVLGLLQKCQKSLHEWGVANQVVFEPSKETTHILDHYSPVGNSFKILSVMFDTRLGMYEAIHHLCAEAGWRLKTLLRTRRFYDRRSTIQLYKC